MVSVPPGALSGPIDPERILVVIPTLNEAAHVEAVVGRLTEGDEGRGLRVVVADGGSGDGTREIVARMAERREGLTLVPNPGRTQAAALNMVALDPALTGSAEVLVRCDAHAAYPVGYARDLARCLAERDAASVVVPMDALAEPGACFQRGLAWIADTALGAGGSPHRGGARSAWVDHGHHAAFRLAAFRALGGYDTAFRANEDAELDRRLTEAGGRIWLEAGIRIGYFPRRGPRALWRQYWGYGRGRAQTCLKHRVVPRPRQVAPAIHAALLMTGIAVLPWTALGLVWPALHGVGALAAGGAVAASRRSACGLAAGPALWIMHTAWGLGFLSRLGQGRAA